MSIHGRNETGLSKRQIEMCIAAWELLCGEDLVELDISEAHLHSSETRWDEVQQKVFLGANVMPGAGCEANCRLSMLACLAHELAHARRFALGFARSFQLPNNLVDEAETSLFASQMLVLSPRDREDLVEDARDRTIQWLAYQERNRR